MPFSRKQPTRPKPTIVTTCDGETKDFDSYHRAYYYFYQKASVVDKLEREEFANEIYNSNPTFVYQVKIVLEEKFGFWVATTKDHKYNIRRDNRPFKFGSRVMFGLTGKELIEFYNKYVKVCVLEDV